MTDTLIQRLSDEADLCRNDGATDVAKLLDDAVYALVNQAARLAVAEIVSAQPAAPADPSRDAYEGCREDLLDWKRRALKAEETCRQLTRALGEDVNGTTFMGEPVLPPRDAAPSVAPEPLHVDETKRYRVVQKGFWWRVQIGDGQQTVGRCFSQTEAQHLAHALVVAYRDGFFVASQAAHPPRAPLTDGELWSWTRSVMSQAACIQQDYAAGKFSGYEQYSAHLDAAAATRTDELEARISAHGIGGK